MHHRSLSEPQGASPPRTAQDGASSWRSRTGMESSGLCSLQRGACSWACLLLVALLVPGARSLLSPDEELLVELHNYYRGQVSPSASAMLPLKWDPNLKVLAESYAARCIWNHNPDLRDIGENLFAGTGPLDLSKAVEKWFLEHLDYDYQNNSCDEDKMCGHYTQMVWADTHRVGCAFHRCHSMMGLPWENVSFLVCNYFPAGNYDDQQPYVEGDWCSSCPENLQKCENNLCVPDVEDPEEATASDPPPEATPTATPTAPVMAATVSVYDDADTPPPGTTDQDVPFFFRCSTMPTRQGAEPQPTAGIVIWKQGLSRKTESQRKASAGSASTPSVLLACLSGLLTLWL